MQVYQNKHKLYVPHAVLTTMQVVTSIIPALAAPRSLLRQPESTVHSLVYVFVLTSPSVLSANLSSVALSERRGITIIIHNHIK